MPVIYPSYTPPDAYKGTKKRLAQVHRILRGTEKGREMFDAEGKCEACQDHILPKETICPDPQSQIDHATTHIDWFRADTNQYQKNYPSLMMELEGQGKDFIGRLLTMTTIGAWDTLSLLPQDRQGNQFVMQDSPFPYNPEIVGIIQAGMSQEDTLIDLHLGLADCFKGAGKEVKANRNYGQPVGGKVGHNWNLDHYITCLKVSHEKAAESIKDESIASSSGIKQERVQKEEETKPNIKFEVKEESREEKPLSEIKDIRA